MFIKTPAQLANAVGTNNIVIVGMVACRVTRVQWEDGSGKSFLVNGIDCNHKSVYLYVRFRDSGISCTRLS